MFRDLDQGRDVVALLVIGRVHWPCYIVVSFGWQPSRVFTKLDLSSARSYCGNRGRTVNRSGELTRRILFALRT